MTQRKIKVGDKVRCIAKYYHSGENKKQKVGDIFTVISIKNHNYALDFAEIESGGPFWNPARFEVVEEVSEPAVKKSEEDNGWGF